jgi:hypothetical protein
VIASVREGSNYYGSGDHSLIRFPVVPALGITGETALAGLACFDESHTIDQQVRPGCVLNATFPEFFEIVKFNGTCLTDAADGRAMPDFDITTSE